RIYPNGCSVPQRPLRSLLHLRPNPQTTTLDKTPIPAAYTVESSITHKPAQQTTTRSDRRLCTKQTRKTGLFSNPSIKVQTQAKYFEDFAQFPPGRGPSRKPESERMPYLLK